jgi:hypothetical protein
MVAAQWSSRSQQPNGHRPELLAPRPGRYPSRLTEHAEPKRDSDSDGGPSNPAQREQEATGAPTTCTTSSTHLRSTPSRVVEQASRRRILWKSSWSSSSPFSFLESPSGRCSPCATLPRRTSLPPGRTRPAGRTRSRTPAKAPPSRPRPGTRGPAVGNAMGRIGTSPGRLVSHLGPLVEEGGRSVNKTRSKVCLSRRVASAERRCSVRRNALRHAWA